MLKKISYSFAKINKIYQFKYGVGSQTMNKRTFVGSFDKYIASPYFLIVMDGGTNATQVEQCEEQKFAQKLKEIMSKLIIYEPKYYIKNPRKLVEISIQNLKENSFSSTTITVLTIEPETGVIRSFYIGDSIYGMFKVDEILMAEEQNINFDKAETVVARGTNFSRGMGDTIQRGVLKKEDYIVVASDGLWDNMSPTRVHYRLQGPLKYKSKETPAQATYENIFIQDSKKKGLFVPPQEEELQLKQTYNQEELASILAKEAKIFSKLNRPYESPFYLKAKAHKAHDIPMRGREDDITVLVASINIVKHAEGLL